MANIVAIRQLLETIRVIGHHLTDNEVSDIAKVLASAMERMEKGAAQ